MNVKILAILIIDNLTGFISIETSRTNNEFGHIERKETLAIETTRITLWQHKRLGDVPLGIDVTEIGSCEETVVTTRTKHYPARVRAPVVERLRIL